VKGRSDIRKGEEMVIIVIACVVVLVLLVIVLVLLRLGIREEEKNGVLAPTAQTRVTGAARAVTGLYVRTPERTVGCQAGAARDDPW
jgi:flagellar basal body-associated protein FliL